MDKIKIKKTLGNTDVKYKILTCGAGFPVPKDSEIRVYFNDRMYNAKTHSTAVGRIDRLSALYKDNSLDVGAELDVVYDPDDNTVYLNSLDSSEISKISSNTSEEEKLFSAKDTNDEDISVPYDSVGDVFYTPEIKPLGINNPNTWSNLPRSSMKPYINSSDVSAAANQNWVVLAFGEKLYCFDRNKKKYKRIDLNEHLYYWGGTAMDHRNLFYYLDDNDTFSFLDVDSGLLQKLNYPKISKSDKKKYNLFANKMLINEDGYSILHLKSELDTETPPEYLVDNCDRKFKIPKSKIMHRYEICEYTKNLLLTKYNEAYYITQDNAFNIEVSLYDYILGNYRSFANADEKEYFTTEFYKNIYAVNLASNTVVIKDFPGFVHNNYLDGRLICIRKGQKMTATEHACMPRDICNKYSNDPNGYYSPHHCGEVYRDIVGHEVAVDGSYYLCYREPNGRIKRLFHTNGSGVPEHFCMVDNHTAVINYDETLYAIVDFVANEYYLIDTRK